MSERNLYEVTGDIKDINTLLVPREQLETIVGEQEPVGNLLVKAGPPGHETVFGGFVFHNGALPVGTHKLYAAPVAQQPRQCGLCGSDEAFAGACGGGKNNPRALCYEPVDQQPQAESDAYCITTPDGDCISTDPRCMHQPQADAVLSEGQIEVACEAVAGALGDAYDCTRVWSAWSYGTMGPEDFSQVSEDSDRVREIALAALGAAGLKVTP